MKEDKRPRNISNLDRIGAIRHGREKTAGPTKTLFRIIGTALAVALVSGSSIAAVAAWDVASNFNQGVELEGMSSAQIPPLLGELEGGFNMMLVGNDTRDGYAIDEPNASGGSRNDVNLLVHVSEDHKAITVVSFPRDLMVPIPECPDGEGGYYGAMSEQPLNASLQYGGLPCVVLTIANLTGLEIQYAGMIGFNGVANMADAVGGVEVCIAQPITDEEALLPIEAGLQNLSGMRALLFLRTRHGIGDGSDLARIAGQQVFMSSLARKITSAETLTDVTKVYNLAKSASQSLILSSNISNVTALASMAWTLRNVDTDQIAFVRYPVVSYAPDPNKVAPDYTSAAVLMDAIAGDKGIAFTQNSDNGVTVDAQVAEETPLPADSPSTPTATPTVAPKEIVVLPENAVGQIASQNSCVG